MVDLYDILWVVPGVIFIHLYNKRRPEDTINLSGWPYLFLLVIIASLTWLPAGSMIASNVLNIKSLFVNMMKIDERTIQLLIAVVFAFMLFLFVQLDLISRWVFLREHDNFYKKCIEWENKLVLLTLKNSKTYIGILWKFPDNSKAKQEFQTISIIPVTSGCREEKTKKVVWNTDYPDYKDPLQFIDMEIIIPRSEIITFGKFNKKTFEYFNSASPKESA